MYIIYFIQNVFINSKKIYTKMTVFKILAGIKINSNPFLMKW